MRGLATSFARRRRARRAPLVRLHHEGGITRAADVATPEGQQLLEAAERLLFAAQRAIGR